jgi:hypothetical protein
MQRMISFLEGYAGNSLHMLLVLSIIPATALSRRKCSSHVVLWYYLATIGGFILFNLLLKWQPWALVAITFFVVTSLLVAVALPLANKKLTMPAVAVVLLANSVPYLFMNQSRLLSGA